MAHSGKGCPGHWHTAAFVRVAESHGHRHACWTLGLRDRRWRYHGGCGFPPRLWAGGFPTGMKGAGRYLGAQYCQIFGLQAIGLWGGFGKVLFLGLSLYL